jgi:hypothetical protein
MMQTDIMLATSRRGEELRYVTEHFRDLQGLYFAWFWAGILLLSLLGESMLLSRRHLLIVMVAVIGLSLAVGFPCIRARYKRYGMVESLAPESSHGRPLSILDTTPAPRRYTSGLFWTLLGSSTIFVGAGLFRGLDVYRGGLNLWITLWFTMPKCFYPTPESGVIQLRRALYIAGSATIFLAVGGTPFLGPLHSSRWLVLEIISATLLILSLYDHWLLNRLLTVPPGVSYD